jgi:hypothetical protein
MDLAALLLAKTDGDLAGWLGDLAPCGDLDSTQLLYRMCGADMMSQFLASARGFPEADLEVTNAVVVLISHGLPLLSLAFRMLKPATFTAARSRGGAHGVAQGSASQARTAVSTAGASACSKEQGSQHSYGTGNSTRVTKQQRPAPKGSGARVTARNAPSFIEAWTQSP